MSADFFASNPVASPPAVAAPPPVVSPVAHAGLWSLPAHHALSLRPAIDRELHIASGRVWVTLQASHASLAPRQLSEGEWVWPNPQASAPWGDQVLQAGDRLWIPAGSHVVMEAWSVAGAVDPVCFDWVDFDWPSGPVAVPTRFECEVVVPLQASARALGEAVSASTRGLGLLLCAVWGVLRYSEYLIPRRGQVLSELESCRS